MSSEEWKGPPPEASVEEWEPTRLIRRGWIGQAELSRRRNKWNPTMTRGMGDDVEYKFPSMLAHEPDWYDTPEQAAAWCEHHVEWIGGWRTEGKAPGAEEASG